MNNFCSSLQQTEVNYTHAVPDIRPWTSTRTTGALWEALYTEDSVFGVFAWVICAYLEGWKFTRRVIHLIFFLLRLYVYWINCSRNAKASSPSSVHTHANTHMRVRFFSMLVPSSGEGTIVCSHSYRSIGSGGWVRNQRLKFFWRLYTRYTATLAYDILFFFFVCFYSVLKNTEWK